MAEFHQHGIRFHYPENWQLEQEEIESGWIVSVQSPETAFWMLSVRQDEPEPDELAQQALGDLRESYPDLEAEAGHSMLASQKTQGYDVRFFSFDLTNTCWIRSFRSELGTILVMYQVNDLEMEQLAPVLRAICASLRLEE
ncbi:MAG TPA: hypothetical protein VGZ47_12190 [Gemmataceae bacterium]|jgi:hypothetical protein|nr:hypothetical protein [Gemmataceae bacterium]